MDNVSFDKGDVVRSDYLDTEGMVGVTQMGGYQSSLILVKFPGWKGGHNGYDRDASMDKWYINTAHLTKVKDEGFYFTEGDKVRINDMRDGRLYKGKLGTITIVDRENTSIPYLVKFADGHTSWFSAENLDMAGEYEPDVKPYVFSVGDNVMVVSANRCDPPVGLFGEVLHKQGAYITVSFPGWTGGHSGGTTVYRKDCWNYLYDTPQLVLVEEPEPKLIGDFIVVNKSMGSLFPDPRPYVHPTQELAEADARRLADLGHADDEFIVFKAVSTAEVPSKIKARIRAM